MPIRDISPDPVILLSVEEFRKAYASFIDTYEDAFTDKAIARRLQQIDQSEFDEAIRSVKFAVYKKLFWSIMSTLDIDP